MRLKCIVILFDKIAIRLCKLYLKWITKIISTQVFDKGDLWDLRSQSSELNQLDMFIKLLVMIW